MFARLPRIRLCPNIMAVQLLVITALIAGPFLGLASVPIAYAASIAVTTTEDELNQDGDCSLREAIRAVNTHTTIDACPAGGDDPRITLSAGRYTLTLAGRGDDAGLTGDLDIIASLTLTGTGARTTIIDGNDLDTVFAILGATTTLSDLSIENGASGELMEVYLLGGGIYNTGTLTLRNSNVRGNFAGPYNGKGGGIYNSGALTLINSTVSDNTAGGGHFSNVAGGGIYNSGEARITNSTISGNRASSVAYPVGGGIYNSGMLILSNSTVSANETSWNGATGAGIYSATDGTANRRTFLTHTIVGGNRGGYKPGRDDCVGTIVSEGYNLIQDPTGCNIEGEIDSVITGEDPQLTPLADNGGPTFTHALLPPSPAIDSGVNVGCEGTDQRGFSRPLDGNNDGIETCDIGAYERFRPDYWVYLSLVVSE